MTIQSYLVYPQPGQLPQVMETLLNMPGCLAVPAANRNVLVLVTEADDGAKQYELERKIEELAGVQSLALVSAWTE